MSITATIVFTRLLVKKLRVGSLRLHACLIHIAPVVTDILLTLNTDMTIKCWFLNPMISSPSRMTIFCKEYIPSSACLHELEKSVSFRVLVMIHTNAPSLGLAFQDDPEPLSGLHHKHLSAGYIARSSRVGLSLHRTDVWMDCTHL